MNCNTTHYRANSSSVPGDPTLDALRARTLLKLQAHERVLDELPADPAHQGETRAVVLAARGHAQLVSGRIEAARKSFEDALRALPEFPPARVGLAQLTAIQGDLAGATALVEQVLAQSPRSAEAWTLKASLLRLQGNTDGAVAACEQWARFDPTNPLPQLTAAEMLIGAGRFDAAQKQIEAVRSRAPGSVLAGQAQAMLHYRQGSYAKALESLQAVRRSQPDYAPSLVLMAMTHLATGAVNQAEEVARGLVKTYPNDPFVRKLHAATLIRMGNAKAALASLAPLLQQAADDPALLALAAQAHMQVRDFSTATALLEQAARLRAGDPQALMQLAAARLAAGDSRHGLADLERAIDSDQDNVGAQFMLANALMSQRAFDKALAVAKQIQAKQPQSPIGFNLAGAIQGRMGDIAAATASFEQAARLDPGYWPAARNLARIALAAGNRDAAQKHIERALERNGANVDAIVALSELSGDRGRLVASLEAVRRADPKALRPRLLLARFFVSKALGERALALAREAVAIAPASPEALDALGMAQLAADRKSEALTTYRSLTTDHPRASWAHYRLAQVQATLGDVRGAEAAYQKALSLQPDHAEATVELAQLLLREGRAAEAMQLADRLKQRFPKAPLGHALAGDLTLAQGKSAEAVKLYDAGLALAPAGALLLKRHVALVAAGRDPGLDAIERWLDKNPQSAEMRIYLASRQYAAGNYAKAIEHYRRVAEADPYDALALNNLAAAYSKVKDDRALSAAEAAYKLKPDDPAILDTYGMLLARNGKPDVGAELLKKAVAQRPDEAGIRVNYALALARTGEGAAAKEQLEKALASGAKLELEPEAKALLGR